MIDVIPPDLVKADNLKELHKILDVEFPDIPSEARVLPTDLNHPEANETIRWYSS